MKGCTCHECMGWGHNPVVAAVHRHVAKRTRKKVSRAQQAGRDQDRAQRYRSLHPAEIMGGGLVAPRPRRARDTGGDDYAVAVQAWLDRLEASGHADDVARARQGSFWRSARTGRGWAAQERSATGQRRGSSSRPLADWMKDNPRPRRADFHGERERNREHGPAMSRAEWQRLQRDLDDAGW